MKTILEFPRDKVPNFSPEQSILRVRRCTELGWTIRTADADISPTEARKFIDFWHPDGCLVNNDRLPVDLFRGIPTVLYHRHLDDIPPHTILNGYDEEALAAMAVRELLTLDLASYAYVPFDTTTPWSLEREQGFLKALKINFKGGVVFPSHRTFRNSVASRKELAAWLAGLPRPIGVFAACDQVALQVLDACVYAGLDVPGDVAVIGVDNDERLCETARPTISSVAINFGMVSYPAFDMLQRLIARKSRIARIIKVKPTGIVRRGSTMRFNRTDKVVIAARDLIRANACKGLKARDVAALFPCSRRMAEIRFRAATGHSILEEINAKRREFAQALLKEETLTTTGIAAACGYASWSSVHRLLRTRQIL